MIKKFVADELRVFHDYISLGRCGIEKGNKSRDEIVYDILCKPEKWDNLLGNTPQIPTPGGKNGTTEDFTRPR